MYVCTHNENNADLMNLSIKIRSKNSYIVIMFESMYVSLSYDQMIDTMNATIYVFIEQLNEFMEALYIKHHFKKVLHRIDN